MIGYQLKRGTLIRKAELILVTERDLSPPDTAKFRGFMGTLFRENEFVHNHLDEGFRYQYPRIQFHILDGKAVMTGLSDGAEAVFQLRGKLSFLKIGEESLKILESRFRQHEVKFGDTISAIFYRFISPWLALNEKNYEKYKRAKRGEREEMLQRILIGNILSMAKGLGYVVTQEIKVGFLDVRPVRQPVRLKGVPMIGFTGSFSVNFDLPDYIGLGKSVSRGFGTIVRLKREVQDNGTKL